MPTVTQGFELGDSDDGQEELRKAPSGVVWGKDEKNFKG